MKGAALAFALALAVIGGTVSISTVSSTHAVWGQSVAPCSGFSCLSRINPFWKIGSHNLRLRKVLW
jgi:hypothetical protein